MATQESNSIPDECQFIDVREPAEFASEKIAGAKLVPLSQLEALHGSLDKSRPLLIVCRTGNRARQAAEKLEAKGFTDVRVLQGGIEAWKAAGKPIEKGTRNIWAIDRQVRFTAGLLVLTGILGSWLVHPTFIYLSLFVGAGLTYSGLSNWCGMALLLAKMPWNR